ncbi:LysM repeat protein [Pullulanibacillus pueri]|uniref:Peptidoglycan endopeptidase n=1 Tax=Pullulanibacillus pueri TaxID=1437324 RepID=A0A8J2ZU31_9BACL|nr:LysM peptidoglycan-binding domain-containing protein [Pullulanibacillus pueri]MBM7681396.1 LysM repeat protein [Pullulanibacillus pueri]GGH78718.1 hypothetical protein GCM10007096_12570 [Pullulanibacillus pueri]
MTYDYELKKINNQKEEYELIIYLNDPTTEFAVELGRVSKARANLLTTTRQMVMDRYPNIRITMAKVVIGGIAITSFSLLGGNTSSAETTSTTKASKNEAQSSSIYYYVVPGDTLWKIASQFSSTIDNIKRANHLTSDTLILNQKLVIPMAFHTVGTGDYLTVLAKKYGTTVEAIKTANGLKSDATQLGQTLIIPMVIGTQAAAPSSGSSTTISGSTYSVVSGDSLSVIAKRYGTTVEALRSANHLTSDLISVGQILKIPSGGSTPTNTTAPPVNKGYVVRSGDTLWNIAHQYGLSVDQLKQANQLTSNTIQVGQALVIPKSEASSSTPIQAEIQAVQNNLHALGYYAVTAMTGTYDSATKQAISTFQTNYGLPVTGVADDNTIKAIDHAIVKKALVSDTTNYLGVPYLWGGTTPTGFDCSGFVYYMFNQHGVTMSRNTSGGLYTQGTPVARTHLQPGDLVFFAVNTTGTISHVGFYMGGNQFISATDSKGIAIYSMDNTYWSKYYVGAKRVY